MRLMLTSFGLAPSGLPRLPAQFEQIPRRMPPYELPYPLLLLFDDLVVDVETFGALIDHRRPAAYRGVAETLDALNAEGFVTLVPYRETLEAHRETVAAMVDADLRRLNVWAPALRAAAEQWAAFVGRMPGLPVISPGLRQTFTRARTLGFRFQDGDDDFGQFPAFDDAAEADLNLAHAQHTLRAYLAYVNSNLVLSASVSASLHDWADFGPFYAQKFDRSYDEAADPHSAYGLADHAETLFETAFPEFAVTSPAQLLRILTDRRVADLRKMVRATYDEGVSFDAGFARSVYREVIGVEQRIRRYGRIAGYATQPLSLLPLGGLVQLGVQELATKAIEARLTRPYRWFYLLAG